MAKLPEVVEEFASDQWEREIPKPIWSRWLAGAGSDGPGFRRWQRWIWWTGQRGMLKKLAASVYLMRGFVEAPYEVWSSLRQCGEKTKRVHDISRITQYKQLLVLRWRYGMRPESYYRFQMFLPDRIPVAQHFIEQIGPCLQVIHRRTYRAPDEHIFSSKEEFRSWCAAKAIPTVDNLLEVSKGKIISRAACRLPASDLFVKPTNWRQGRGVSLWRCKQDSEGHCYTDNSGTTLNASEMEDFVCRTSLEQDRPYIVQQVLTNHRSLRNYSNGGLATVRLMTVRSLGTSAQPLMAALKMPTGDAIVDNFDRGGVAAPIDLDTGVLGAGLQKKGQLPPDVLHVHPDTGSQITGFTVPCWAECLALACRAHDLIQTQVPVIGWDIAILDDGPIIIEPNHLPCQNLAQMPGGFPLGVSPFAEIVIARLRDSFLKGDRPTTR